MLDEDDVVVVEDVGAREVEELLLVVTTGVDVDDKLLDEELDEALADVD